MELWSLPCEEGTRLQAYPVSQYNREWQLKSDKQMFRELTSGEEDVLVTHVLLSRKQGTQPAHRQMGPDFDHA